MNRRTYAWQNGCFKLVHPTPNHHPPNLYVLPKSFLQNILAAYWLVWHSIPSKQQRRPLSSVCLFFCMCKCKERSLCWSTNYPILIIYAVLVYEICTKKRIGSANFVRPHSQNRTDYSRSIAQVQQFLASFCIFFLPKTRVVWFLNFKHCSPILFPSIICMWFGLLNFDPGTLQAPCIIL